MAADPIVYCLEQLTDYTQFERLGHELMALEGYASIEPLGGCKDKGRDAIHVSRADKKVTIFCYSVRDDWRRKLEQDAEVIKKHHHPCDRLTYLSTYDFTPGERDDAVTFIKNKYGWELEPFGLERLRLLLSAKHHSLIPSFPQIFHPAFFEREEPEPPEIPRIRSLMDRLTAANEKYMRSHVRWVMLPCSESISQETLMNRDRHVTVAVPTSEAQGSPPPGACDVVFPRAAMQNCSHVDFWGVAGVERETDTRHPLRMVFLVWGGSQADSAVDELTHLAAESGRLYQTLPPSLAPIHGTTSPRNLWATVLYGWLRGTRWLSAGEGFEYIGLPFAASAELWRRLLHGTTPDGRIQPV